MQLIHHLFYPENSSINDYIDNSACSVQYFNIDQVADRILLLGTGVFFSKILTSNRPFDYFQYHRLILICSGLDSRDHIIFIKCCLLCQKGVYCLTNLHHSYISLLKTILCNPFALKLVSKFPMF